MSQKPYFPYYLRGAGLAEGVEVLLRLNIVGEALVPLLQLVARRRGVGLVLAAVAELWNTAASDVRNAAQ